MLVMSLEDYDEVTGKATKAAIMHKDVVGPTPAVTSVATAEEGLLVSLDRKGTVDLPYIATLYGKPEEQIIAELGDSSTTTRRRKTWQTADAYLSGNVRAKLAAAEAAGPAMPATPRPCVQCSRRTCCPATSTPTWGAVDSRSRHPGVRRRAVRRPGPRHPGRPPEEGRGMERRRRLPAPSSRSPRPSEFGTPRANGVWLLELALNLKTPVIYDTIHTATARSGSSTRRRRSPPARSRSRSRSGSKPGSSPTRTAPSGWCGSTTTPTTTCGRGSSTARTSISPA